MHPIGNTLPNASPLSKSGPGNSFPRCGNKLPDMGRRKPAEKTLAENYVRLRDKKKSDGTLKSLGVAPKTANNVENARHNTKLTTIVKLADALGVEPYQMLIPVDEENFLSVILAWAQSDKRGRDDLHAIAEAILKRRGEQHGDEAGPAIVYRRGNNSG